MREQGGNDFHKQLSGVMAGQVPSTQRLGTRVHCCTAGGLRGEG